MAVSDRAILHQTAPECEPSLLRPNLGAWRVFKHDEDIYNARKAKLIQESNYLSSARETLAAIAIMYVPPP